MSASATASTVTAVVIDDNEAHLDLIRRVLEDGGDEGPGRFTIETYTEADRALAELPAERPVVILCDYKLPGASGLNWLSDFIRADAGPVIIVTSSGDERIAAEAFRNGAADYVDKASIFKEPQRLRNAIGEALRRYKLEQANRELARKLKLANAELERKNETLAELTDTAHRFVDDVAHEFRTPLAVIKEFAAIMADGIGGPVNEKQAEYLRFIADASRDLAHLVDDFLDSGKLRARTLRVRRRPHDVAGLVDAAWPLLEARAASKRVTLAREIAPGLPTVFADEDKVRRTLINLVVNAIKFSGPGDAVTVSARLEGADEVCIGVRDHGPGLAEEEVRTLFERFHQGGAGSRVSGKGFGLGLNIVRELVAINLGAVSVQSTPGEGSTFAFTLPRHDPEVIVERLVTRTLERHPDAALSALAVRREPARSRAEDLGAFVASVCHATDVPLPGPDGSVLVVGAALEPQRWRERLLREDAEQRPQDAEALHVEHLGTWPAPDARDAVLEMLRPVATGVAGA